MGTEVKKLKLISVMYEVKNPVYQDYKDIVNQYKDNLIVMTNIKRGKYGEKLGGIVRFYGSDRKALIDKNFDLLESGEYGTDVIFTTLMSNEWKELPWYYEEIND